MAEPPAWKAPAMHHGKIISQYLRKLFDPDPKRGRRLTVESVSRRVRCVAAPAEGRLRVPFHSPLRMRCARTHAVGPTPFQNSKAREAQTKVPQTT